MPSHLQKRASTGSLGSNTRSVSDVLELTLTTVFRVADSSNSGRITFDEFVVFETCKYCYWLLGCADSSA
jgi:hypothetical protein